MIGEKAAMMAKGPTQGLNTSIIISELSNLNSEFESYIIHLKNKFDRIGIEHIPSNAVSSSVSQEPETFVEAMRQQLARLQMNRNEIAELSARLEQFV